jgi:hypothetical protein
VHAEDGIVHDSCQGEVIEDISAIPPYIERSVFAKALIVEAVDLRDLSAFVVASDKGHQIGVAYFVGEQKEKCLYTIKTTVDEITEEEVADSRNIASILEQFEEIVKLSVYVSADSDGGIYALNVALLNKDFSCFGAEVFDFLLADDFSSPKLLNLLIDLTHQSNYLFIYRDNSVD